nr:tetratricopeptide repeat protein [Myxococcota bacterium]
MSAVVRMRASVALAVVLMASALAGCGGATTLPYQAGIEEIRRRAQERPNDPEAQSLWAEAELLMSGGDPEEAERAIARARELSPDDPRVSFLHAMERHNHGDPEAALDAYLRTVTLASRSRDPLAPVLAEVAVAFAIEFDDSVARYGARVTEALAPLHADPGAIGPQARHAIGTLLAELAYRRGDVQAVDAVRTAQS